MILSDATIRKSIETGKIRIFPDFDDKDIRPAGVRLHLGDELLVPIPGQTVDLSGTHDLNYEKVIISNTRGGYVLRPGEFVLGTTYETIHVPTDIVAKLDGRSTLARLGLLIHCSSDTIDGNHEHPRSIVLEMKNIGTFNLILKPRIPIALLVFHTLTAQIQQKSQAQYGQQTRVQAPNMKSQLK